MTATPQTSPLAVAFQRCLAMDAPVNDQLAAFARVSAEHDPAFAAAIEALVARLKTFDVGANAPHPGEPMPPFALPDETGALIDLESLLEVGPAVVVFHRGHWCPFCRINSTALARVQKRIAGLGARMVAIMPDLPPYSGRLKALAGSDFPFLTDIDNGYAMSANLVFRVDDALQRFLLGVGNEVPRYQGNQGWFLPIPATFVVGRDGRVVARHVDPDYRRRMDVEDLLSAVARAAEA